jgi:adenylate cyclase, class 2
MQFEVEMKFPIHDLAALQQQLQDLQCRWTETLQQSDLYFGHPARDFSLTDEALRLRCTNDICCITYKGPKLDRDTKTRHELELPLLGSASRYSEFRELLRLLGFREVFEVKKTRTAGELLFEQQVVHVCLDHIEQLGDFLELEILATQEELPVVKNCLLNLANSLKLPPMERRSYLEMLFNTQNS